MDTEKTSRAGPPPPRRHAVVGSPLGPLRVVVDACGALAGVYLPGHAPAPAPAALGPLVHLGPPVGAEAAGQGVHPGGSGGDEAPEQALRAACDAVVAVAHDPSTTTTLALAEVPGTAFQHAVWSVVAGIAPGQTLTYAQVAAAVGRPTAHRAVGRAVGANPRCLVVPCHRVVGSGGAVTGYAGGVALKRWLLAREQGPPTTVEPALTPP